MGFISLNTFGKVPRLSGDPTYPRGYGVPNPVPTGYATGNGSLLLCGRSFESLGGLLREHWLGFQRDLVIRGTVSMPSQTNFTSVGAVSFDSSLSLVPIAPEDPGPALPRPTGADPLRGLQVVTPPPGILDAVSGEAGILIDNLLVGTIDFADSTTGSGSRTDLPVFVRIKARRVFDLYPWYVDVEGSRTYYCNIALIIEAEGYWEEGWTAEPMPSTIFPPWVSQYDTADEENYRGNTTGELWSVTTPGVTVTTIDGAMKLGEFGLREQVAVTAPYTNVVSFEHVRFIVTSNYHLRADL